MKTKLLAIFFFLGLALAVKTQELNCQIEINSSQLQGSTLKQITDQMKKSIYEFMNNTKWSSETYTQQEKIECSILIVIKDGDVNTGDFSGTIQVTSRRPVYKSSYYTEILNIEDEFFQFRFQQFSQLEFNINTFQSNLTQVLAYYAYVIIATDNDSFAPQGGTAYWQKAQQVVNNSQTANELGWKSNQNDKNRYWLVENTLQPVFKGIRDCMYEYCRNGMDKMYESTEEGRATILKALDLLKPVYSARPASYNMQVFFNCKRDELINIFKGATSEEKTKVKETLMMVDPAGTTKYDKI